MDCLLPPHTTIPAGIWKCPLRTPPTPSEAHPRVNCDTSASPLPSLTLTLTKDHLEPKQQKNPSLVSTNYYSQQKNWNPLSPPPVTNSGTTSTCTHMKRGEGLKPKFSTVVRHGGDLRPRPRRVFSFWFFSLGPWNGRGRRLVELTDGFYNGGDSHGLPGWIK